MVLLKHASSFRHCGAVVALGLAAWTVSCTRLDNLTAPSCAFVLASASAAFDSRGGTGTVAVNAPSSCRWTVTTNDDWVAIDATSGSGEGNIGYTVAANSSVATRRATLSVAGHSFTVSQSGIPANCTYTTAPGAANYPAAGGSGAVTVTTADGCPWSVTSQANWITIESVVNAADGGAGSGVVNYVVAPNPSTVSRGSAIAVAGRTVTISQSAAPQNCTFTVSPASASFGIAGGSGTITVTTQAGCAWTATTDASWISITGDDSGSGNGAVGFVVSLNTTFTNRVGAIVVGGRTVTVSQSPLAPAGPD